MEQFESQHFETLFTLIPFNVKLIVLCENTAVIVLRHITISITN